MMSFIYVTWCLCSSKLIRNSCPQMTNLHTSLCLLWVFETSQFCMIFLSGRLSSDEEQPIFTRRCRRDGEAALYCITLSMQVCGRALVWGGRLFTMGGWQRRKQQQVVTCVHIMISFHQGGSGPSPEQEVLSPSYVINWTSGWRDDLKPG